MQWRPGFKYYHLDDEIKHEMGNCVPKPLIGYTEVFYGLLLLVILISYLWNSGVIK